jgi:hypothetical protein
MQYKLRSLLVGTPLKNMHFEVNPLPAGQKVLQKKKPTFLLSNKFYEILIFLVKKILCNQKKLKKY